MRKVELFKIQFESNKTQKYDQNFATSCFHLFALSSDSYEKVQSNIDQRLFFSCGLIMEL